MCIDVLPCCDYSTIFMRQHRVFTTSININAQPDRVMEFLGDLRNQKSLHPLILKV